MKKFFILLVLCFSSSLFAANKVLVNTSMGKITLELYQKRAPKTVANFLDYVHRDGYKGTIFHRVIKGFMIQGGGFLINGQKVHINGPIQNEARNDISNLRGTIVMARTNDPNSANRQFFINEKDNKYLDAQGTNSGYAVFGKVTKGMDVVDKIAAVKTDPSYKPTTDVVINSIRLLK